MVEKRGGKSGKFEGDLKRICKTNIKLHMVHQI